MGVMTDLVGKGGLLRKKDQGDSAKREASKDSDSGPISKAGGAISKGVNAARRRNKSPSK